MYDGCIPHMFRFFQIAAVAALVVAASSCKHSVPENVAATVNGHVITYQDLDKQYQLQFSSADKPAAATLSNGIEKAGDDQTMTQKIEVLRVMIDNQIMLQRAEKLGLMATDADVDAKLTELKAPFTQEEFLRTAFGSPYDHGRPEGSTPPGPEHRESCLTRKSLQRSPSPTRRFAISIWPIRRGSISPRRRFTWPRSWLRRIRTAMCAI